MELLETLTSLSFWLMLLSSFQQLGPIAPVFLAFIESFFPMLPLVAIVSFHMHLYGAYLGFFYTWAGCVLGSYSVFLILRYFHNKIHQKYRIQVSNRILLLCVAMPFVPSLITNSIAAQNKIKIKQYFVYLLLGKGIMMVLMIGFANGISIGTKNPLVMFFVFVLFLICFYSSKIIQKKYIKTNKQ